MGMAKLRRMLSRLPVSSSNLQRNNAMRTKITVAWAHTVELSVEPEKMTNAAYVEAVKMMALEQASKDVNLKEGMVTDCEDFPEIAE
jgi:hypothetical protein